MSIPSRWRYQLVLQGQPVELPEGEISLGRSRSCTVPLKDPSVSRSHALLMIRGGEVSLRDLNSSNGTFVNGARLAAERAVQDGDRILFGETEAIVRIVPPPENPLATAHVDLDRLFCETCKAPFPAHLSVCANCGARRDAGARGDAPPSQPGPTAPAAAVPFSGTGSRQVLATPGPSLPVPDPAAPGPAAPQPAAPPAAARASASSSSAAPQQVLSPITGFDETVGRAGAPPDSVSRSHATAPRSLPAPPAQAARPAAVPRGAAVPRPQGGTLEPAGFWIRFAAWFVDTVWMTLLAMGAGFAVGGPTSAMGQWLSPAVYLGVAVLVPVLGWGLFGTTPGKRLFGLYVGPVAGGVGVGIGKALLRWVGTLLSMALLGLGFVMIGLSKDKRGLHDQIAGTVVGRRR